MKKTIKFVVGVIVAIAVVSAIANGGKKETSASGNAGSTGGASAGPAGVTNEVKDPRGEHAADVVAGKCSSEFGFAKLALTITNPSSKPSTYSIDVSFFDTEGTKIGDGFAFTENVASGAKALEEAVGTVADGTTLSRCEIVKVTRTASL